MTTTADRTTDRGFQDHAAEVYGWAYRLLGRHHDALDVVQDVFLKWSQQSAQDRQHKPRGWLRRVTLNRTIDLIRGEHPAGEITDAGPVAASPGSHLDPMDQSTLRSDIGRAMDSLSEAQRSVLIAKVYDELTFKEIAEETGLAVSTVKTHYLRALGAVREQLRTRWAEKEKT